MLPTKFRFICPSDQTILASDWLISKKSSLLKPLGQMNQNLVGTILGMSSINVDSFAQEVSEEKIFRSKNGLWRACLFMDRN
jgi:hypothetical protein